MNDSQPSRVDLQVMARQIMLEYGFEPDFPVTIQKQLADIKARPLQTDSPSNGRARPTPLVLVVD